jgi:small subunit ribosomal protein S17
MSEQENDKEIKPPTSDEAKDAEIKPPTDNASGEASAPTPGKEAAGGAADRGNRAQRVGVVSSDKMMKTVSVRVDRIVKHPKYRRYVRRTSKFMAHDEMGATIGDKVRIVETRPLSARKRWRVVEIIQKAAK